MAACHPLPSPEAYLSAERLPRLADDEKTFLETYPHKGPQSSHLALAESLSSTTESNGDLQTTDALYLRQLRTSSSLRSPAAMAKKPIHRDLLAAFPDAEVSHTYEEHHFQSSGRPPTSAIKEYPKVRYPTGAPGTKSEPKDHKPLLSPILLESLSNSAYARSTARSCEFCVQSKSGCEKKCPSCPYLRSNSSDRPHQSLWNHGRDANSPLGKSQLWSSSETINENELYWKPDSIFCGDSRHPDFPQRKLSYGGTLETFELGTLQNWTESGRLKRKARWSTKSGDAAHQVGKKSNASEDTRLLPHETISHVTAPPGRKLGLESDALEPGGCIEEAHLATMTSPSKPQIVTILRRSCPIFPMQDESGPVLDPAPPTPPETPTTVRRVRKMSDKPLRPERAQQIAISTRNKFECPISPPNSPASLLQEARSLIPDDPHELSSHSSQVAQYEPIDWVLDDLEFMVAGFPEINLQLDSPVIQHLRLQRPACSGADVEPKSRFSPFKTPHSRYSIFKSLSSHPVTPRGPQISGNIIYHGQSPTSLNMLYPTTSVANPTLGALRNIFPKAPSPVLECLQATYLALHYISLMHSDLASKPHLRSTELDTPYGLSNIPPKARAMLGILPNPSPKAPRLQPRTPDQRDHRRIRYLLVKLRDVIRQMLGHVGGRKLGIWDDAFLRAVGEMVRMGEERRLV